MTGAFVSVIVPVYNDAGPLALCLDALESQTYPGGYEVVVVDNGSAPPLAPHVRAHPHARVVVETRPGSYPARNRGVAVSRGEVIAFTDADCVPKPDWIERGVEALHADPGCGAVAGRIELAYRVPTRPTAIDLYSSLTSRRQHANVEYGFGETANLFTWRRVLDEVGPFEGHLRARGDVVWGRRLGASGYKVVYGETVVVRHPAPSFAKFCRRVLRMTGGRYDVSRRPDIAVFDMPTGGATDRGQIRRVMTRARGLGRKDRLRVLGVALLVQALVSVEWARLRAGGGSVR